MTTFYDYTHLLLCCKRTRNLMTFDCVMIVSTVEEKRAIWSIILTVKGVRKSICTVPTYPNLYKRIVFDVGFALRYFGNRTKIALLFLV